MIFILMIIFFFQGENVNRINFIFLCFEFGALLITNSVTQKQNHFKFYSKIYSNVNDNSSKSDLEFCNVR